MILAQEPDKGGPRLISDTVILGLLELRAAKERVLGGAKGIDAARGLVLVGGDVGVGNKLLLALVVAIAGLANRFVTVA